jgi:hypothetical protein
MELNHAAPLLNILDVTPRTKESLPAPTVEVIRAIMAESGSKYMRIDATKKDGSVARFVFNRARNAAMVVGACTESGAAAAVSRRINHPDLVNVWCIRRQRWSSFDATCVVEAKVKRRVIVFRGIPE